jgi:integrase
MVGDDMEGTTSISDNCASSENTFEENLDTYVETLLNLGLKESTADTNRRYMRMVERVHGRDPVTWAEEDVSSLVQSDTWRDWSPGTRRVARAALKNYWEVHQRGDLLPPNNLLFWRDRGGSYTGGSNTYDKLKAKTPTDKEFQTIIDICREVVLTSSSDLDVMRHMATFFAASYGLRRMEVNNLRLCDIDLEGRTLHIEKSKGDKSRDVYMDVPITEEMWARFKAARSSMLKALRKEAKGKSSAHVVAKLQGLLSDRAATLFFSRTNGTTGNPLQPNGMSQLIKRCASHILGRSVNPHALRHAKAFYLIEVARVDLHQAKEYLGHATINQTLAYSYTGVAEQKAAFERAEDKSPEAPTVLPDPAPSSSSDFEEKVRVLGDLHKSGVLTTEAFGEAMSRLFAGSK